MSKCRTRTPVAAVILLSAFSVLYFSCKGPSAATKTPSIPSVNNSLSKAVLDSMKFHAFRCESFSGKAKVEVLQGKDKTEFTASIRMRKDSAIWISVSPGLGFEAGRVLMTKDSIRIINRIDNDYMSTDYSWFKAFTAFPVSFKEMQDLIQGSALFSGAQEFEMNKVDSGYSLVSSGDTLSNRILLNSSYLLQQQNISEGASGLNMNFQQYDITYTSPFSLWRKIELLHPKPMQIVVTFSKIKINEPVSFPFNVKD